MRHPGSYLSSPGGLLRRGGAALVALFAALVGAGCQDIDVTGAGPLDIAPRGVIEGSVVYVGPKPMCVYDGNGVPIEATGILTLTLVDDDEPLPPEGTAQGVENLLAIPGDEIFSDPSEDCRPADPALFDPSDIIMRSADFSWPQITLAQGGSNATVGYRVLAVYDMEPDFNPFFLATSTPTAGDVTGAAIEDATQDPAQFDLVTFGSQVDHPQGQVVSGVTVTLGAVINTEPPVYYLPDAMLSTETSVPFATSGLDMQNALLMDSAFTLRLYGQNHQPLSAGNAQDRELEQTLALLRDRNEDGELVGPRFIDHDFTDPVAYAWYYRYLDTDRDGQVDRHPVLGEVAPSADTPEAQRIQLLSPVVLMQRIRTEEEARAGIPNVGLQAASPNYNKGPFPSRSTVAYPDSQVMVPPLAALLLNTEESFACQIPYVPPGSPKDFYEQRPGVPIECHEVPSGRYSVNVLHGVVNGVPTMDAGSPTGFNLTDAPNGGQQFANQIWAIPNELGDPDQVGDLTTGDPMVDADRLNATVAEQSIAGAALYHDPDTSNAFGRQDGNADCSSAFSLNPFEPPGEPDYQSWSPFLNDLCCAPIVHLCDVPLCPVIDDPDAPGFEIVGSPREGTSVETEFTYMLMETGEEVTRTVFVPECIPFYMPTECCPGPVPTPLTDYPPLPSDG